MDILLDDIDALTGGRIGTFDAPCPECGPGRRSSSNRNRKVLRIWRKEPAFASYMCARCGSKGYVHDGGGSGLAADLAALRQPLPIPPVARCVEARDEHAKRRAEKAQYLWRRRQPPEDTPTAKYLREARGYTGPVPAMIGYLPPQRPEHHPAMISAFGITQEPELGKLAIGNKALAGIHLTLLKPDGSGKAGTDRDKLMVGPSNGWPIVLAPPNDLLGLVICEGIETGLSLAEATGCGVWAAGAAGRMPLLADKVPEWVDYITIAGEPDDAGRKGALRLAECLRVRGLHYELRFLEHAMEAT